VSEHGCNRPVGGGGGVVSEHGSVRANGRWWCMNMVVSRPVGDGGV
jgi:hypothetical protein